MHGLVQDCSISTANALEILQCCTKPLTWYRLVSTKEAKLHLSGNGVNVPFNALRPSDSVCVGKLTTIGSDNGLAPGRCQVIIWTNAGILLIGLWGTNLSEILLEIYIFSFKKIHFKMPSGKRRPFCLSLSELNQPVWDIFLTRSQSHSRMAAVLKQCPANVVMNQKIHWN